jgi:hypothetical protein
LAIDACIKEAEALIAGGFAERLGCPVETTAIDLGSRAVKPAARSRNAFGAMEGPFRPRR